jgi:arylsulfatase A-like enzyme
MSRELNFRSTVTSLCFRLITLGIIGFVFIEALVLAPGKAQGWSYYLTVPEVIFEVLVRLIFAALVGAALGTISTVVLAPFLWHYKSQRNLIAERATKVAVFLVVFFASRFALKTLITWSYSWWSHGALFDTLLLGAFYLAFIVAACLRRARREVVASLDGFLDDKMTRRTAIATVAGAAALVATEFVLAKTSPVARATLVPQRPKSNFLLITFDALSAEDMSLYGYKLPTTPNIDAFASKSTVFNSFYSASTFTTPCVATMLTGMYPSESKVYQLEAYLRATNSGGSLPQSMRAGGYATGAFFSNPYAYYLGQHLENNFDFLPEPTFQNGGLQYLWDATTPLHQNSGIGSRIDEYVDLIGLWNPLWRLPGNLHERFRAAASFQHAREMLAKLPDGFFLWVHVMTPHGPYLPDSQERGRFLAASEQQIFEGEGKPNWKPHYPADQQGQVDHWRLRYDEFILTADRAFGAFMSEAESAGKLQDTTVIVSADHGESFEGGIFQHGSAYLTRPVIHVPLIIRTPGQQDHRTVAFTADQTSLAPTILELAGQPRPEWMRGQSLVGRLNGKTTGEGEGQAFCQYFEKNSVFRPLHHGTVGVIGGKSQYQYVWNIDTQKGALKPLKEAQIWNLDRSAENPALAEQLRATIASRFPELVQRTS